MDYKKLSIIAILLLALPCVCGALVMDVQTHQNRILPNEEANFTISVTNPEDETQKVEYFFPSDPSWSIITNPIISKRNIAPNETIQTEVRVMAVDDRLIPKKYELPFTVSSLSNGVKKESVLQIYLRDPAAYRDYVPIVNVDVDATKNVVPTDDASITFILSNRNRLNITDFTFEMVSTVNEANNQVVTIQLPPNEKVSKKVTLSYPDKIEPQTDVIKIIPSIPSRNKTYETITKEIEIKGYTDVKKTEDIDKGFLKTKATYTFTNEGNIPAQETQSVSSSALKEFFTSANPDYEEINANGYKNLQWNLEVQPSGTQQITVIVNYRPLFIIILLVLVAVGIYYLERSPVVIKKEAKKIPGFEGETSRLKVLLHVKNRTNKPIENLNVVDTVPKIAQLGKKQSLGTMQPSKVINNEKKGTIIKWNVPVLEAYEERIISYQIYSKLEIIGPMRLTKAIVKYKNKRGKQSRVFSNDVQST